MTSLSSTVFVLLISLSVYFRSSNYIMIVIRNEDRLRSHHALEDPEIQCTKNVVREIDNTVESTTVTSYQ